MRNMAEFLGSLETEVSVSKPPVSGKLTRVVGLTLEAVGCRAAVGSMCRIETATGTLDAEVVGFSGDKLFLMPSEDLGGVVPGARVVPLGSVSKVPLGMQLLGRVIDGIGTPLDGMGPIITSGDEFIPHRLNPLARRQISEHLDVGVKAINAIITVGKGQRMGLFAGSGVGKSVLLGMMTRGSVADVCVVGLIGERGREVKEFIEDILGPEGRARSVVVAAPADASPLMRLKGCETALTVAEYFRDQGKDVLLLMDSLTRYAQAQREIALAIGEPPATKGYPPSVFAKLPALVERAGNGGGKQGSITAFFTVLTEGDDLQDPIADASRAILDGHIVLNRALADGGHFPAIDIQKSISRVMPMVTSEEHMLMARTMKQCMDSYERNRDLITIGAYQPGADPRLDVAIALKPQLDGFLQQRMKEIVPFDQSLEMLKGLAQSFIDITRQKTGR